MAWVRLLGGIVIRFLSKKLPWFGAMITWVTTETPLGHAIEEAFGLFTGVAIPTVIFAVVAWLWLRDRDAKARARFLDIHLPRAPETPATREDDDAADPDVDPSDDVAAARDPVEEGARA